MRHGRDFSRSMVSAQSYVVCVLGPPRFWVIWRTDPAKYTRAVIGIAIGYAAKYILDVSFEFKVRRARRTNGLR